MGVGRKTILGVKRPTIEVIWLTLVMRLRGGCEILWTIRVPIYSGLSYNQLRVGWYDFRANAIPETTSVMIQYSRQHGSALPWVFLLRAPYHRLTSWDTYQQPTQMHTRTLSSLLNLARALGLGKLELLRTSPHYVGWDSQNCFNLLLQCKRCLKLHQGNTG
jgi:hypothetical protein